MQMIVALLSAIWMLPCDSSMEMSANIGTHVYETWASSDPNARLEEILRAGEELRRSEQNAPTLPTLGEVSTPSIVQRFDPQPFEAGDAVIESPSIERIVTMMFAAAVSRVLPSRVSRVDEVLASLSDYACNLVYGDANERMKQLLNASEELRQIEDEWRKFWFADQMPTDKPRDPRE